jgi:hypothetical protein
VKTRCEWSFTSVSVGSNRAKQIPSLWLINDEDYILGIYVGLSMKVKYPLGLFAEEYAVVLCKYRQEREVLMVSRLT